MINTKIAKLKINLLNYNYSACLFLYEDIILDKEFIKYIDELFKTSKVEKFGARLLVKSTDKEYEENRIFLKDIYDHKKENHIIIFKNKKVIAYTPLDKVIEIYTNTKAKMS